MYTTVLPYLTSNGSFVCGFTAVFPLSNGDVEFAKKLEKATLQTIEEGYMTGDIARIAQPEAKEVLDSWKFIEAIRSRL